MAIGLSPKNLPRSWRLAKSRLTTSCSMPQATPAKERHSTIGLMAVGFWDCVVPQNIQTESVVRNAAITLGQAHYERVFLRPTGQYTSLYGTEACIKAITALRRYMRSKGQLSREVVLVCCVLFHTIELMREYAEGAKLQLENRIAILEAWQLEAEAEHNPKAAMDGEHMFDITTMMGRLDFSATLDNFGRMPQLDYLDSHEAHFSTIDTSLKVTNARDAHTLKAHDGVDRWKRVTRYACYRDVPISQVPDVNQLSADINLNAQVAGLVTLNAGVQVSVQKVNITIADVDAQLELVVRLGHLVNIVNRVFQSLDLNPLLINTLNNVTSLLDDVVGVVDSLLGSITQGGSTLNFLVDNLGNIVQEVGGVSSIVGSCTQNMTETGVAQNLGNGLTKKLFSYSPLNPLVNIVFNTAGQVVQATVEKKSGSGGSSSASATASATVASSTVASTAAAESISAAVQLDVLRNM